MLFFLQVHEGLASTEETSTNESKGAIPKQTSQKTKELTEHIENSSRDESTECDESEEEIIFLGFKGPKYDCQPSTSSERSSLNKVPHFSHVDTKPLCLKRKIQELSSSSGNEQGTVNLKLTVSCPCNFAPSTSFVEI